MPEEVKEADGASRKDGGGANGKKAQQQTSHLPQEPQSLKGNVLI
jgi:hypothetical protein